MTKMLKTTGLILSLLLLIAIVGIGILARTISPNQFKPMITAQVLQHTGRQLTIDGDIAWRFFPSLGFKVGHMVLENPAGFKQKIFAEISQATIGIKLMPLLHAKVESTGISLAGLRLNLIKNAKGTTNWQDLQPQSVAGSMVVEVTTKSPAAATSQPATTGASVASAQQKPAESRMDISLDIPRVDVNDAQITWVDEVAKQSAEVSHFALHAENISLNHPFAITSAFNFAAKNPTVTGDVSLSGNINLNLDKEQYQIDGLQVAIKTHQNDNTIAVDFSGNLAANMARQTITLTNFNSNITNVPGSKEPVAIKGDVTADLAAQTVKLTHFGAQIAKLVLAGNVDITHLNTTPAASGHLKAEPFDLKKLLQDIGQDTPVLNVAKMVTADFDFTASGAKTTSPIQAVTLQGKIKVDQLQAAKLKASHLNVQAHLQNGVLEFVPVTASLYQGTLESQMKMTLTAATPQIAVQAKLTNVQAEPLLQDLGSQGSKMKLKGAANIDLQITTAGTAADAVVRNLNGTGHVTFKEGQLTGINMGNLIDTAYAFLKHQSAPADKEDSTHFGDLTATAVIHNGVITNNDLTIVSPRFDTKGQGTLDLVNQTINYALLTTAKNIGQNRNDKDMLNLYSLAIPVSITGRLSDPSIRLDTQTIGQEIAKMQVKRVQTQVQDKIRDQIKDKVSGQAGAILQNLLGH